MLGTIVYGQLLKALKAIENEYINPENNDRSKYKQYYSMLKKVHGLRSCKNRNGYSKSIIQTLKNTRNPQQFDMNPDLLCFTNGVYDLKLESFRTGQPEDYISRVIPYDWAPSDSASRDKLMSWIDTIMPFQEERDCMLRCLSSTLNGRLLEYILILVGSGRNGKDSIITGLLNSTLGDDFYYNNNVSLLTQPPRSGISQEKSNMNKKRCVVYAEPSKNETLKCAVLKELRGCPVLSGRGIYSKDTKIHNFGTTIIHTNSIPPLDVCDEAIENSLVVIPFRSLFRTAEKLAEYPEGTEHLHLVNSYYKSREFLLESRLVFMNILLDYHKQFKSDGYMITNIPQTMKNLSKEYMSDSNDFVNWFYEQYEKTDDDDEHVKIKDVYSLYKQSDLYTNLSKKEKRKCNKKNMIKDIQENPTLRPYYRLNMQRNGTRLRNILQKHRLSTSTLSSDYDSDDE
jgi:phage/plasmid-associated DNA primase